MNGSGFYRIDDTSRNLLFGPNFVYGPGFTLLRADQATYTYPVEGWYWFESEAEARVALDLPFVIAPDTDATVDALLALTLEQ